MSKEDTRIFRWFYTHVPRGQSERKILDGSWATATAAASVFPSRIVEQHAGSRVVDIQTVQLTQIECAKTWAPLPLDDYSYTADTSPAPDLVADASVADTELPPDTGDARPTSKQAEAMISDVLGFVFGDYTTQRFDHFSVVGEYKKKHHDLLHASRSRTYNLRQAIRLVTQDEEITTELWRDIGDEARAAVGLLRKLRKEHKQEINKLMVLTKAKDEFIIDALSLRPSVRFAAFMMERRLKFWDKERGRSGWSLKPTDLLLEKIKEKTAGFTRHAEMEPPEGGRDLSLKGIDTMLSVMMFMDAAGILEAPSAVELL